jgi:LuxR family maltose regulon positive regulatory protein
MTQLLGGWVDVGWADDPQAGLPELDSTVILRRRLAERLTEGSEGLLTVVEAPTGSGKTVGVAGWASRSEAAPRTVWVTVGPASQDAREFWTHLRSALLGRGAGPLPQLPSSACTDADWSTWLSRFGAALTVRGPWIVVLDDYPAGRPGVLGQQLATVLGCAGRALRLVVTCTRAPALELAAFRLTGEYTHLGIDDLRLDEQEIAKLLAMRGVAADAATASSLCARTFGWARGIALAVEPLQRRPVTEALAEFDLAIDQLLDREVLAGFAPAGRELIMRTSVVTEVPAGLAHALMGSELALSPALVTCEKGFVEVKADGSFRCHPLLRAAALRRLDEDWPALAREARRAAAAWHVENGDRPTGIQLASDLEDWSWVAKALVRSLAVPSIILGAAEAGADRVVERSEVSSAEPLILAAAAVRRGDLQVAEAALDQATEGSDPVGQGEIPRRLSEAVIAMAILRQRAQPDAGLRSVGECRRLAGELSRAEQRAVPELFSVLDAHEAAFQLFAGDLDRAADVLELRANLPAGSEAQRIAAAESVGLLAWVEALRGNLTSAAHHAAVVLTARPADGVEVGVGYAQLAAAWIHLERGELDQAGQRLAHRARLGDCCREPWLSAARRLAEARLATAAGDPDAALRILTSARRGSAQARAGWLGDLFTLAAAEAHLSAGEPREALTVLTPEPQRTLVESRALRAAARASLGDKQAALNLLLSVEGKVAGAALPTAVQVWSLEAQLSLETGDSEQARCLTDRALQAATQEQLRLALAPVTPWIRTFLARNPALSRRHRTFVASLVTETSRRRSRESSALPGDLLQPLTERELDVLQRLAQLWTTEEIASDLFVSVNTVKTHIKSLFLKLAVNRRADAVRRGHGLALC